MRTTDLFKNTRSAKRINESIEKTFGKRINLESFDLPKLEDARNKLRTQIHDARSQSGFNENLENETLTQAQWMLDAINAEIAEREEFVVDAGVAEVEEGYSSEVEEFLQKVAQAGDYGMLYDAQMGKYGPEIEKVVQEMYDDVTIDTGLHPDDDFEDIYDRMLDNIESDYGDSDRDPDEGGETDDDYAMASAGFGSDEDYGTFPESIEEKAPPGAKAERMVKHIKKGYADDGKLTKKEKGIAYATAWKQHNKEKNESVETGEDMTKLQEGEIQQASAIVTAKTMVDRVGRWIEELSGMENDTLLQLGDSIRDEMGSEQAKNFISACAPAIQAALENLKATRETLSTGVRQLTGEEQAAGMLGAEPEADLGSDLTAPAEPDAMNMEPAGDEFAAAEPAAGGLGDSGREQRESINYQNRLLNILAG
jgi:hypothetical protein